MTILFLLRGYGRGRGCQPLTPEANPPKEERMICKAEKFVGSNLAPGAICDDRVAEWRDGRRKRERCAQ